MKTENISKRDYFAATCPEGEIDSRIPDTFGAMRDELIHRGMIPTSRRSGDVLRSYSKKDQQKLRCIIRFEYADDMVSLSNAPEQATQAKIRP